MKLNDLDDKTKAMVLKDNPTVAMELKEEERKKRQATRFNADDERTYAIMMLNVVAKLTKSQRGRVLRRACKMNDN
jgi:hypothetical protein|tara:strand:+ start:250 stop:477 length:228 start_codon:yes stop_codon:yes gene_type:complete